MDCILATKTRSTGANTALIKAEPEPSEAVTRKMVKMLIPEPN